MQLSDGSEYTPAERDLPKYKFRQREVPASSMRIEIRTASHDAYAGIVGGGSFSNLPSKRTSRKAGSE